MSETESATVETEELEEETFEPSIAVFHCRWCLPESEKVRALLPEAVGRKALIIKINCSARMEAEFAIKAFGEGYDGVLVLGCEIGECHYLTGNHQAIKRLGLLRDLLALAGIYPERLGTYWVSPFDEQMIKAHLDAFLDGVREAGSFTGGAVL
jgi:coenzyme F420-reducing hydrogenase delta subunit